MLRTAQNEDMSKLRRMNVEAKTLPPAPTPFPLIGAGWLLRWFAISIAFAALCGYLTMCLLFYLGQWQVVFHPSRTITATPAALGIKFDDVRFDYTETGTAQLDGWWIPSEPAAGTGQTILYLHDGSGSLSDSVQRLKTLHSLGVNLFAIDYRGFGLSLDTHPSEQRVYADADAAISYLEDVRHIDATRIVLYGAGLGATIAAEAARRHPQVSGLVLDEPGPSGLELIRRDPRTKLLPVRLLFRDRLELEPKLRGLRVPTLALGGNDPGAAGRFLNGLKLAD